MLFSLCVTSRIDTCEAYVERLLGPCEAELLRVQQGLEEGFEEALKRGEVQALMERSEKDTEALRSLKERISEAQRLNGGFKGPKRFQLQAKVDLARLQDSLVAVEQRMERRGEGLCAAAAQLRRRRTSRLRSALREAARRQQLDALEVFGVREAMALEDFVAFVVGLPESREGKLTEEEAEQIFEEFGNGLGHGMGRLSFLKVAARRLKR